MDNINITQSVNPMIEKNIESNKIIKSNKKLISNEKQKDQTENGTTISNIMFIQQKPEIMLEKPIPKDTISTSTGTDSNFTQQENNSNNLTKMRKKTLSFSDKTKQWAGNVWNSIKKIKNMIPKTEYHEYRNANGDIVKIPKKKIPLKKKKYMNNNVNNRVSQEQNKIISNYHGAATGLYIIS